MRGGPDHSLKTIHAGEIGDVEVFLDVLDRDAPRIAGALENGFDLRLDPRLLAELRAMLQVLELLLEIGPPARLRGEPALGDLKVRHARFVERIEKAAIAARIARRIATLQNGERDLSSRPGRAAAFRHILAPDRAQEFEAGRSAAAPAEIAAFEPRAQVRILIGEHRELAGGRMTDEENISCCVLA